MCYFVFPIGGPHIPRSRAGTRARAERQEKGDDIQGSRDKGKGEMEFLNLSIVKSDVHFLVAGVFDLVGSNVTVSPWSKQTKYFSSSRWPKYTKNAKNEWRPPRKSHSRWDINRPFPQGDREGHCARSARTISLFCGVFRTTKHADF